ncbi:alpha/beta hydrolase family protein [Kitasatospora atroaurantiaca]|uniref:Alpha/beta hydrolase family protein n=1 Tax=Kitasatospora atroaurantiaca TaxID=285545 RepID=A0A561EMR4_9ACTN|nr:alpha/beta hydrolase [Kitasatospora atroaurantiaca]TWE16921.1 alpha/beta hydrolase family protein [Kitasatospora atroaurantiaca]
MQRRRVKRMLIGAFAAGAVLVDAGAAAAQAAAANEQVAISTPPAGSAEWVADHSLGRSLPDPATADARTVAAFFTSLTPEQTEQLIAEYPLVVGNLDGAPLDLRYRANRVAIAAERDRARARAADQKLDATTRAEATSRADDSEHLLARGRQILAFDPRGRGLVSEVYGDLAKADRVSVLVPGSDADLGHFDQAADPLRSPAGMARALVAEEHRQSPGTRTAVIAWTGYVTPSGLGPDAVTSRLAEVAAPRLERLLAGLAVTSAPEAPPALFCHSYGSVVCGTAAPEIHDGQATDVVVFGSPGMGVQSTGELGDGVRVWATRNPTDWIGNVPYLEVGGLGHGADPTTTDFGAVEISSAGAVGHTGYLAANTSSLHNFGAIALGRYQSVSHPPATA